MPLEGSVDMKDATEEGVGRGLIPFPRVMNAAPPSEVLKGAAANEVPNGAEPKGLES
jgi:Periviscerokinin family